MRLLAGVLFAAALAAPAMGEEDPWSAGASWEVERQELTFEHDDIRFSGTLHVPSGVEEAPAVVVTHGAGPGEENTPLYRQIADLFPAIGFAVVTYDRRGSGDSGGERTGATYKDLARDAIAAKEAAAESPAVDGDRIGLWGLSQGGWIVMEAAAMSDPAFAISVAAPLTTPGRQMQELAYNLVLIEGYGEAAAERAAETRRTMDAYFRGEIDLESARARLGEVEGEDWYEHTHLPPAEELPEDVEDSTWILEMDYDPIEAFKAVEAPFLYILAGKDYVIPVKESLDILADLPSADNRKEVVIPDADHAMAVSEDHQMDADPTSDANAYFLVMGHWLGSLGLTP